MQLWLSIPHVARNTFGVAGGYMKQDLSISAIVAGLIAVIVSYAGPLVIVFQAANAAGLSHDMISSWIGAISIGSGVAAIIMSIAYRAPVITAWSTPGAALLVLALPNTPYPEAIGAFIFAAGICTFLGLSGMFDTVVSRIPKAIAAAMLAGILFRFGAELFGAFSVDPLVVGLMAVVYFLVKRFSARYAITAVLCTGLLIAFLSGEIRTGALSLELATPVLTAPRFSWQTIMSLGMPLALVSLTGQFVPGVAVLRTFGYRTPANPLVWITSVISLVIAPFGSHGINLAAITAAICSGPEAHPDAGKRYIAGVALGVFYIVAGVFGATLATLFAVLPKTMIATLAGLALLGAIANGLTGAMADEKARESALITFLITASGVSFLGLGSAFWGLVIGLLAYLIWSIQFDRLGTVQPTSAKD